MVTFDLHKDLLDNEIRNVAFKAHAFVIDTMPRRTGKTAASVVIERQGDSWVIGTNDPNALRFEFGTRPHIITPKTKKALAWRDDGRPNFSVTPPDHYAKKVRHPGTPALLIFQRTWSMIPQFIDEELRKRSI